MEVDKFKFGDLVVNEWASDRVLMVVSVGQRNIRCLTRGGEDVKFKIDKSLRLKKVGYVDFSGWQYISEEVKSGEYD